MCLASTAKTIARKKENSLVDLSIEHAVRVGEQWVRHDDPPARDQRAGHGFSYECMVFHPKGSGARYSCPLADSISSGNSNFPGLELKQNERFQEVIQCLSTVPLLVRL